MAYIKPNQPVIFNESVDLCSTDTDYYVQIVDNSDKTQFQLELTICFYQSQLLPDPNFNDPSEYTLGTNWNISNNTICHTSGFGSGFSTVYNFDSDLKYYQATVVVDSISNAASFNVYFGSTFVGSFSSVGTHVFYGFPSEFFGIMPIAIVPNNITDEVCISSLSAFDILTNFIVAIYDTDDNYIISINYNDNPEYFVFKYDSVTITIDWEELAISNGCYYLCLLDPCINTNGQNYPAIIINPSFTGNANGWTLGANWVYNSNAVDGTFTGTLANNFITQTNVFNNYLSPATIQVTVPAKTGNINVFFGTALVGTITATGVTSITGTPVGNLNLRFYINSGTATISDMSVVQVDPADYQCDLSSNVFKLGNYISACPETLLINACNNEDGMGFIFNGSGFTQRLRLQGKLRQAKYTSQRIVEEDSNGKKRVVYYSGRKSKNLVADLLPEYIHDFLRTLIGYDNFYINSTAYFVDDDEYNVTYDDSQDNVGSISLLVSEKTQLIRNKNCSDEESSCSVSGNYLLQADDLTQYITLTDGELIELN